MALSQEIHHRTSHRMSHNGHRCIQMSALTELCPQRPSKGSKGILTALPSRRLHILGRQISLHSVSLRPTSRQPLHPLLPLEKAGKHIIHNRA